MAIGIDFLIISIFCGAIWLPLLILHSAYIWKFVDGHLILGERKLVHRLLMLPVFRVASSVTFVMGQLILWSDGGNHWLGMVAAFRILAVVVDRLVYYALIGACWRSWKCARQGLARNESRSLISMIIFTTASDLIWLASDAKGKSALPVLIFRSTFHAYTTSICWIQCKAIIRHTGQLVEVAQAPCTTEMMNKVRRFEMHAIGQKAIRWFALFYGVYCVGYLGAYTQGMLPKVVPIVLWEELAYFLFYMFMVILIYKDLAY